jgi:hypothetical protein
MTVRGKLTYQPIEHRPVARVGDCRHVLEDERIRLGLNDQTGEVLNESTAAVCTRNGRGWRADGALHSRSTRPPVSSIIASLSPVRRLGERLTRSTAHDDERFPPR